jgi:hypothetical protein
MPRETDNSRSRHVAHQDKELKDASGGLAALRKWLQLLVMLGGMASEA